MIRFVTGNLLEAPSDAIVNTVNTVGIMGKGIALQFKEKYPQNFKLYLKACKEGWLQPGKLLVTYEDKLDSRKVIVNFPTKTNWRLKSEYEYIDSGLAELARFLRTSDVSTIALPPLGCGNGGLEWNRVKQLIIKHLSDSPAEILVYEPHNQVWKDHTPVAHAPKLTPARAMLLYCLYVYQSHGESVSLFVANKLAYFLQRLGEPLRLNFAKHFYGPYSPQVENVLYYLNGSYIEGLQAKSAKQFESLHLNYEKWPELDAYVREKLTEDQRARLRNLQGLIEGFESTLALEVLSSVAFLKDENPSADEEELHRRVGEWSNRKKLLVKKQHVGKALDRLLSYSTSMGDLSNELS